MPYVAARGASLGRKHASREGFTNRHRGHYLVMTRKEGTSIDTEGTGGSGERWTPYGGGNQGIGNQMDRY